MSERGRGKGKGSGQTYASRATVHRQPVHHPGDFDQVSLDRKLRSACKGEDGISLGGPNCRWLGKLRKRANAEEIDDADWERRLKPVSDDSRIDECLCGRDTPDEVFHRRESKALHQTCSSTCKGREQRRMSRHNVRTSQERFERDPFLLLVPSGLKNSGLFPFMVDQAWSSMSMMVLEERQLGEGQSKHRV